MGEIVKGTLVGQSDGGRLFHIDTTERAPNPNAMSGPHYLLVPDDGTRQVVTMEEWERRDKALRACESNLRLVHDGAGPVERGAPMPTHTTFAAWRLAAACLGSPPKEVEPHD